MTRVGPYQLRRELGRGGMGAVHEGLHVESGQAVALKLLATSLDGPAARRFATEARALGQLRHPNVVAVHAAGEDRGRAWLSLELVRGRSLEERLEREGPLPPREAARVALAVARGVAHAHARGVLHRDLKPANVLLPEDGGEPKVTDFGLASFTSELTQSRLTKTGTFIGTPGYWAPEQAAGEVRLLGPRTDVYGLGAVLYAALTGRPPIEGSSLFEAVVAAQQRRPASPKVDPTLDALALACLEKRPDDRPPSAEDVADRLVAYLDGRPPSSARSSRRRTGAAIVAATAITSAAGLVAAHLGPRPPADPAQRPTTDPPVPRPDSAPPALERAPHVATGSLESLRAALRRLDEPDVLARLDAAQRDQLQQDLTRLALAWDASPGARALGLDGEALELQREGLQRLILIHALLRRLDPAHRVPPRHHEALSQAHAMTSFRRWSPEDAGVVAELVALRPDDVNAYLMYADTTVDLRRTGSAEVDLGIHRRGMLLARSLEQEQAWSTLFRHCCTHWWARGTSEEDPNVEASVLERLALEAQQVPWGAEDAAFALGLQQELIFPASRAVTGDPRLFVPERVDEALDCARRAAALAPDAPEPAARLAIALSTRAGEQDLAEALGAADLAFVLWRLRRAPVDERLAGWMTGSVCRLLERRGDAAASAELCARALVAFPALPLLPVAARRALLLCRLGASREQAAGAIAELQRRVAAAGRALSADLALGARPDGVTLTELDDLARQLDALARSVADGTRRVEGAYGTLEAGLPGAVRDAARPAAPDRR